MPVSQIRPEAERAPWTIEVGDSPVVAVSLHSGHDLRGEVAELVKLPPAQRLREEDPYTDLLTEVAPTRVVVNRSRFEVDLNRPAGEALCLAADDCWGLDVWSERLPARVVDRSCYLHAAFYSDLRLLLHRIERRHGRFLVLDLHSYNHRRGGPTAPPDPATANPDVNVGTGSLNRDRWGHVVDRLIGDLSSHPLGLDVRENVKFRGRRLAAWIHEEFPETGCCPALEFKKTFMDEWSGRLDERRLGALREALASTVPGLIEELFR
jgi:hypothetical protein